MGLLDAIVRGIDKTYTITSFPRYKSTWHWSKVAGTLWRFPFPPHEVESETGRVIADIQKRAKLPGFRPGKAPASLIRKQFSGDIRQQVLESLIPKYLQQQFEAENLNVVGRPDIKDVHFHDGEPLSFKAEFEVVPEIELQEYHDVEVPYHDPEVTDEDVEKRLSEIREQKAQYVNVDPRPLEDGDFAVVALESLAGVEGEPVKQDEMVLEMGGPDTFEAFTENLRGLSPGDEKEFDVTYPEDYGAPRLAGKTVKFHATVKGMRRKELPELNDEFAQDLGDYRNVDELRDAIRKGLVRPAAVRGAAGSQEQDRGQAGGRARIPGPGNLRRPADPEPRGAEPAGHGGRRRGSALAEAGLEQSERSSARQGAARSQGLHAVVAGSPSGRRSTPPATKWTRKWSGMARQNREPVAAVQMRFEKDGTLGRIANHIQTEKTLISCSSTPARRLKRSGLPRSSKTYSSTRLSTPQPWSYIAKEVCSGDNRNEIDCCSLPRRQPGSSRYIPARA